MLVNKHRDKKIRKYDRETQIERKNGRDRHVHIQYTRTHTHPIPRRTNSFCFCHARLRGEAERGFTGKRAVVFSSPKSLGLIREDISELERST